MGAGRSLPSRELQLEAPILYMKVGDSAAHQMQSPRVVLCQPLVGSRKTAPESSSETPDCQTCTNSLIYILSEEQKNPLSTKGSSSIWPAFAAGQTVLRNHKPCCTPKERQSSNKQALLSIPKPPFLEQMESYLKKELQALDWTKENAQELKLQPYREVFEFFIDSFKTYKPLLFAIRNEYEVTLAYQKKRICELEPLKAMVATASEECTLQILALQEKQKEEIRILEQEKQHLLKIIGRIKEEKNSLQTQVERLQASVAEEYFRYLNEHSARKLLLEKLNDMNAHLDMRPHQEQVAAVKGVDVVKLTLALKVARQDLTKAHATLNQMKASYGDDVPRRDFESLEKKYSDLLQETKTLQKNFDQLHKEYEAFLEIQRKTAEERQKVFPGGVDQWHRLAEGKTSVEIVDVLLEEIGTRVLKEIKVFHGWGKGDNVPVYLRHEGEVRNRKLTKKDVVNILKDVWKEKIALEQTGKRSSLPELFLSYLQKWYRDAAAMEWSYTLFENTRLCRSNYILSSTYAVLTGQVGEEQYHSQNQLISNLQKLLAACDSSDSGSLTSKPFSTVLREAFPLKRKESIKELVDASRCKLESNEDHTDYISLFREDEEGNAEPFVAKLRTQYIREKQEYLRQLKNDPGNIRVEAEITIPKVVFALHFKQHGFLLWHQKVKADDLKTTVCTIDPGIDDQTLDTYIGLAYQVQTDEPAQKVVPVETVLERLTAGDGRRVGPSPEVESTTGFEGEQGDLQC
ncbi:LOW QUALITY PROTEIN: translin-associated factor X-interacting protein 1 [Amazona ochrocephala]